MKRFKYILRSLMLIIFLFLTDNISAQTPDSLIKQMDSVEISLLTCQPGKEVYSLYGHTAIRYQMKSKDIDVAINYGLFSFGKPYFILRFIFGLTDYEMGIAQYFDFIAQYKYEGRGVKEQVLNLTREEKFAISNAIDINFRPENRVYRYNYFYDNCTTRARDILASNINGRIVYPPAGKEKVSYRDMIHQWNEHHLWARFGNDILLGVKADCATDSSQQQFLPDNLSQSFENAKIVSKDGKTTKLVKETFISVPMNNVIQDDDSTPRPRVVFITLLIISFIITAIEHFTKSRMWIYDMLLMTVSGVAGIILTAMIFSEHPTVSLNLQLLLLNPLPLLFMWPAIKKLRRNECHYYFKIVTLLTILFFIGNIFQDYAEGINFVALSLLVRYIYIIMVNRKR